MTDNPPQKALPKGLFDVEHALGMHAYSFMLMPAESIYDDRALAKYTGLIEKCHIYLIGFIPNVRILEARQEKGTLVISVSMLGTSGEIEFPLPEGATLQNEGGGFYVSTQAGERVFPSQERIMSALHDEVGINFDVKYIGQAYGQQGQRNALDWLRKHETLQKISLKGVPDGYRLQLLLLEVAPSHSVITMFSPDAEDKSSSESRIDAGLDKLYGTDERERIALYEASLIRYFQPTFNKEFKDSFPSTNLKILQECYAKDFLAVVAEICFDNLPFSLMSDCVKPEPYHIVMHDLHGDVRRRAFFFDD